MEFVSFGKNGALVFNDNHMYKVIIPVIKAMNPEESGDFMLVGFVVSLKRNYEFKYLLKFPSTCGMANAMETETGKIDIDNINLLIRNAR